MNQIAVLSCVPGMATDAKQDPGLIRHAKRAMRR